METTAQGNRPCDGPEHSERGKEDGGTYLLALSLCSFTVVLGERMRFKEKKEGVLIGIGFKFQALKKITEPGGLLP